MKNRAAAVTTLTAHGRLRVHVRFHRLSNPQAIWAVCDIRGLSCLARVYRLEFYRALGSALPALPRLANICSTLLTTIFARSPHPGATKNTRLVSGIGFPYFDNRGA